MVHLLICHAILKIDSSLKLCLPAVLGRKRVDDPSIGKCCDKTTKFYYHS